MIDVGIMHIRIVKKHGITSCFGLSALIKSIADIYIYRFLSPPEN